MAYVATNIGHVTNSANASFTLSVPSGVPAGATILVGVRENTTTTAQTAGSVTDSAGNTYVLATTLLSGTGRVGVWYCPNCLAVASGGTITYTKVGAASDATTIDGGYVTGVGLYDPLALGTNIDATAHQTITITSGTPAVAGEFFLAFVGVHTPGVAAQGDAAWTSPPLDVVSSTPAVMGGNRTNAGTTTLTFTANWFTGAVSAGAIIGFKPPGIGGLGGFNMPMLGF